VPGTSREVAPSEIVVPRISLFQRVLKSFKISKIWHALVTQAAVRHRLGDG